MGKNSHFDRILGILFVCSQCKAFEILTLCQASVLFWYFFLLMPFLYALWLKCFAMVGKDKTEDTPFLNDEE